MISMSRSVAGPAWFGIFTERLKAEIERRGARNEMRRGLWANSDERTIRREKEGAREKRFGVER